MRQIPDLMMCLGQVSEATVRQIRKTAEDPPRVSVLDAIALITGHSPTVCSHTLQRLKEVYPEVGSDLANFKFSGRGQRDTPVTDARGIVEIIMRLPGRAAARARKAGLPIVQVEDLQRCAAELCSPYRQEKAEGRPIVVCEYRDGTVIDVIRM